MDDPHDRYSIFPSAGEDVADFDRTPETPQTASPAYRLAFHDPDFLCRDELRPVRLQLELLKPELELTARGIESTIVLFGGSRVRESRSGDGLSRYYDEARRFARLCTEESLKAGGRQHVIVTGGGPGVMEAGNRGAADAGGASIGLNIVLPHEQAPNPFVTPELCFNFHYFGIRKMHFLLRAEAVAIFPGGFGTMDELFESLTLIQTERMQPIPVLMFGEAFWRKIVNWEALAEAGVIDPEDLGLIHFVESAEEGWRIVDRQVNGERSAG